MSNTRKPADYTRRGGPAAEFIPEHLRTLFERRPLRHGESAADYDRLLLEVLLTFRPVDDYGFLAAKNLADLLWERSRYTALKEKLAEDAAVEALAKAMWVQIADRNLAKQQIRGFLAGEPEASQVIGELLEETGIDVEEVFARSAFESLTAFAKIDEQIEAVDRRIERLEQRIAVQNEELLPRLRKVRDIIRDAMDKKVAHGE